MSNRPEAESTMYPHVHMSDVNPSKMAQTYVCNISTMGDSQSLNLLIKLSRLALAAEIAV